MRDIPLLLGFMVMIIATLRRPSIGVLVWCWTALLVPNVYVFGLGEGVRFNFWIALTTLFAWLVSHEPKRLTGSGTIWLLGSFLVLATLSTMFSIASSSEDAWIEWEKFVKILALAVVIIVLMTTEARIRALLFAIALSLGFHGVVEGSKFIMSAGGHSIVGPGSSVIGDNNHFALAVVMLIPILIHLYVRTTSLPVRVALAVGIFLQVVTVVGTGSRGGFLGILALAAWILLTTKRKLRFLVLALPLAIGALVIAPERWYDRMATIESANEDSSFMGRVIAWKINTLAALDHPLLGAGFRSTQDFPVWARYSSRFSLLDFVPTAPPSPYSAHAAHSIYFQVLGDMGFAGLAVFLALLIAGWRNASITIRRAADRPGLQWAGDLARTLQYCLVPYIVSGAALNMAYFDLSYIVLALLVVLRRQTETVVPATQREGDIALAAR